MFYSLRTHREKPWEPPYLWQNLEPLQVKGVWHVQLPQPSYLWTSRARNLEP